MKRVAYPAHEALPVDVCTAHGIWFDASELAEALRGTVNRVDPEGPPLHLRAPATSTDASTARVARESVFRSIVRKLVSRT
jgi:hypothetical protein